MSKNSHGTTKPWYVITGAPSSGTSSTATEIGGHGYHWVEEAARLYIDSRLEQGFTLDEIRADEKKFQEEVVSLKGIIEATQSPDTPTFFVRGMQDTRAYMRLHGFTIAPWVEGLMSAAHYRAVFLLDPLTYEQDYARTEGAAKADQLTQLLGDAYTEAGMEPIRVPVLELPHRARFILDHLGLSTLEKSP